MANQRILYTEEMVGDNHPTKADTLNRLMMVEHNEDGTHDTIDLQGGQIAFPDTAVPSADPNTLDDYEEGSWTPRAADAVSGGNTSETGTGTYTKTGNSVKLRGQKVNSINTTSMTAGNIFYLQGVPFACGSINCCGSIIIEKFTFDGTPACLLSSGEQALSIKISKTAAPDVSLTVADLDDDNADVVCVTIEYGI